jgi:SAM-dependent methyltransferase
MSVVVLKNMSQIRESRRAMLWRAASGRPPEWFCKLMTACGYRGRFTGDFIKSWDVWRTAQFLETRLGKDELIVDLGAYQSEILPVLGKLGFRALHGIDLNPELAAAPYANRIQLKVGDFYSTPYDSGSFAAVTSISAIEHGLDIPRLFKEVSRILRPGGFFICSTDYWPEKIDTAGITVFDMSWTVFSAEEIAGLLREAAQFGLVPVGPTSFESGERVISFAGRRYTFAWMAFRKE